MKLKLITVGVLLLLTVCLIVGCTTNETVDGTDTDTVTVTETVAETEADTDAATESDTQAVADTDADTDDMTETETETETTPAQKGYAVLFDEKLSRAQYEINDENTLGMHISVSGAHYLNSITTDVAAKSSRTCSLELCFYSWNTDYDTTVAAEPVFTYTIENYVGLGWDTIFTSGYQHAWYTVDLPEGLIGEGEWLCVYRNGTNGAAVSRTNPSRSGSVEDENGVVTVVDTYAKGSSINRQVAAHVTYAPVTAVEPTVDPDGYTKLSENKAHVIILSGQSNAAGGTSFGGLGNYYTQEQVNRFKAGYDNVFIYSDCHECEFRDQYRLTTDGFVKCKLGGMGSFATTFGPEVGLADYLSQAYPNETFYIIKSAVSGSSLEKHWNENGNNQAFEFVDNHIATALAELEDVGLEPEIFAMVWLQGESDADIDCMESRTKDYMTRFDSVINRITTKYADYMAEGGMAIVDGAICHQTVWQYASILNLMKEMRADASQNYYFVDTNAAGIDTFDEGSDPMHYDSKDIIPLGRLFGEAIEKVLTNAGMPPQTAN